MKGQALVFANLRADYLAMRSLPHCIYLWQVYKKAIRASRIKLNLIAELLPA
jgi:hypothetical protein